MSKKTYLSKSETDKLSDAQQLLERLITNRKDINRVIEMSRILHMWRVDSALITAALILPLVRKREMDDGAFKERFGEREFYLADTVRNLLYERPTIQFERNPSLRAEQAVKLRRYFIYAYTDYEVVLICIAFRLATISDLETMDDIERKSWAEENIKVFMPLMEMFGIWKDRAHIGNKSLGILQPKYYQQLNNKIEHYHKVHQPLVREIQTQINKWDEQIQNCFVSQHFNTPISIQQRIQRARLRGRETVQDFTNLLAIDVLVETVPDCYHILGLIHNQWRPAHRRNLSDGRFVDYIAQPRYNGYRCVITSVMCHNGKTEQLVEFRIRTQTMEDVNTRGLIAVKHEKLSVKNTWWQNTRIRKLIQADDTQVIADHGILAVFTPSGEVMYPFKHGSTVLDVAFRVHSRLGPYARRFLVNGKPVNFKYEIQHRDLVEIEFDRQFPSIETEWEDHAKTTVARKNIRNFLRSQERAPHKGRQLINNVLEREMSIYQMRFPEEHIESSLEKIALNNNVPTKDALYIKVLEGQISADVVVADMIEAELREYITLDNGRKPKATNIRIARSWLQEKGDKKWDRALRVLPGEPIVGRWIKKGKRNELVVHRAGTRTAPTGEDAAPLRWAANASSREVVEFVIAAPPKSHVLKMIMTAIVEIGVDDESKAIILQQSETHMKDGNQIIKLVIDAPSEEEIDRFRTSLRAMQRNGYITHFKTWQLFPFQKRLLVSRSDKRRQNPYTLNRISDKSMFFGRQSEIENILDALNRKQTFIIIYGQQRIGKTSLLYQLTEFIIPENFDILPVLFDAQSISPFNTQTFLTGLVEQTLRKLTDILPRAEDRRRLRLKERDFQHNPYITFEDWVKQVEQQLNGTQLLFIVDEFTRTEEEAKVGKLDPEFYNGLQYLAGNAGIGFLLCLHSHVYKKTSMGWGAYQRGQPFHLKNLEPQAAEQLIRYPLGRLFEFDDTFVQRILTMTDCHPYYIQAICLELIQIMQTHDSNTISDRDLDQVMRRIIIDGDHYFKHFEMLTSDFAFALLKRIAYQTSDENPWAFSDDIRESAQKIEPDVDRWKVSQALGELKQHGLIQADHSGQARYRIPIGMIRQWLKHVVTHAIIEQDLQKKD